MKETNTIDDIWMGDLLGRKDEAIHLQRFIENTFLLESASNASSSFVLNINSEWGYGKSWFLTRLAKQLQNNHAVVYFDAWRNDFSKDALLSFVSIVCDELAGQFSKNKTVSSKINRVKSIFSAVSKQAAPILISALVKQLAGQTLSRFEIEGVSDAKTNAADVASQLGQVVTSSAIEGFIAQKNAIQEFMRAIEELVAVIEKTKNKHLPICILVDELDRCRPTYAIELLESIKHLFAASGIFFIVATDTKQLSHSIKAVYGSEFYARSYLRRFFYAEFKLSRPDSKKLASFLFANEAFSEKLFMPSSIISVCGFVDFFAAVSDCFSMNIRDQEQVFSILKTFVYSCEKPKVDFIFLLFLIVFKKVDSDLYDTFESTKSSKAADTFFKLKGAGAELISFPLAYQRMESRFVRYPTSVMPIQLGRIFVFYVNLLSKPTLGEASNGYEENSHYLFEKEICDELLKITAVSNDLNSYFRILAQAGRVSMSY